MSCTLDRKGKEWYKEKLKPVGLLISDNPIHPVMQRNFALMSQWPKIEYVHIFAYIHLRTTTLMEAVRRV